jgi:hypothetical protein
MRAHILVLLVCLLALAVNSGLTDAETLPGGFGVMGDSISDEYRADDDRGGAYEATTLNWLELLVRYRSLDAGAWGTRSFPRRSGYEFNWALSGARAADVIDDGQAAGLAQQVAQGRVSWALLMIGANDFTNWNGTYTEIYDGSLSGAALTAKIDKLVADITQALDLVGSAGPVRLLVANLTDRGATPGFQAEFPDAARRQVVSNAILAVNAGIAAAAAQRGVTVVDLHGLAATLIPQIDANGNLIVGGEPISLVVPGDEPHHMLLGDDEHAGTVAAGIMANYILDAIAAAGGPSIPRFTDVELLNHAGIFPAGPDTVPPVVSFVSPASGATVSGSVTLTASASDDREVLGVQFLVDGINLGTEDTTAPWSRTWNAGSAAPGPHVLRARARDAAGNVSVSEITVTVRDATLPSVSVTSPSAGATVAGTVTIKATASDNVAVGGVTFYWNGAPLGPEVATSPYQTTVQTTASNNGAVTLTAVARDTSGNTRTSSPVSITVNNAAPDTAPPSLDFTAPAPDATVWGTVTVSVTASDNVRVVGVQFQADGTNLGQEDTTAPYSVSWNTTALSPGPHVLTATARDAAGNRTSKTLTVNVLPPQTIYPTAYGVVSGSYESGGLPSLVANDNDRLVVRSTTSGSTGTAQAELTYSGLLTPVSRLDLRVILSAASNTSATLLLYDFTIGAWVGVSSGSIGSSETTRNVAISSNAARYVSPSGTVRLMVQSSRTLSTYSLRVDLARLTVTH